MATGACGVDCTVCRLHVLGVCSTCGAGTSLAAREKKAAQMRLFGNACPMLACAIERGIDYCSRDCDEFPCDVFSKNSSPYSKTFLSMQKRRRELTDEKQWAWPEGGDDFWERLESADPVQIVQNSGASQNQQGQYIIPSLGETWMVDAASKKIIKESGQFGGEWDRQMPFYIVVYLVSAQEKTPSGKMLHPRELVHGQDYFRGHNTLETVELERVYGADKALFLSAVRSLGGQLTSDADVSARFRIFPKMIVDVLLWLADDEFPAKVSILMDSALADHYPVEGIADVTNLLVRRLVMAARP